MDVACIHIRMKILNMITHFDFFHKKNSKKIYNKLKFLLYIYNKILDGLNHVL